MISIFPKHRVHLKLNQFLNHPVDTESIENNKKLFFDTFFFCHQIDDNNY